MPIRSAAEPIERPLRTSVLANSSTGWSLIRKTSLSSDRSDGVRSSSRHKHRSTTASHAPFGTTKRSRSNARRLRIDHDLRHDRLSERSYLFTMSDISQLSRARAQPLGRRTDAELFSTDEPRFRRAPFRRASFRIGSKSSTNELRFDCFEEDLLREDDRARSRLVEPDGIEPTTSCLQSRRSPN
jgi:hypothetical protein